MADLSQPVHATPGQLAAYLDRSLADADRTRLLEHLAECVQCRTELVAAGRVLKTGREFRRLIPLAVIGVSVAGALLFVGQHSSMKDRPRVSGAAAPGVLVRAPIGDVARDSLRFVWSAVGPGTRYRLTVSGPDGATIWSASTTDTVAVPPPGLGLAPAVRYGWLVDALMPDGTSVTSSLRSFGIHP